MKNILGRKLRKDERRAEKIYKSMYSIPNQIKVEEKIDKIRENLPNIKTKYELFMEQNKIDDNIEANDINNEDKKEDKPVNDWWGDIFK